MLCLEEPANEEVACGIKERNERHDSPRILPNWAGAPKAPQRSEPCAPESKKKKKKAKLQASLKWTGQCCYFLKNPPPSSREISLPS